MDENAAQEIASENERSERLPYAGFAKRLGAFLVDAVIVFLPCFLIAIVVVLASSLQKDRVVVALTELFLQAFIAIVPAVYAGLFESSSWQATPGKKLFKIKVVDLSGKRCTFARAISRNLAFAVSDLSLGLGYLLMLKSKRKQCLHDMVANCLVLESKQETKTDAGQSCT